MRALAILAAVLVSSGCVELLGREPPASGACRDGTGLFVKAQHHPGFTGPEYQLMFYTLERDGRLTYFRAHDGRWQGNQAGTGQVRTAGKLHNITAAQVKSEMQRVGAYSTERDYNVSLAWRHTVSAARFDGFCARVLDEFSSYEARYEQTNIADCDAFEFTITTHKGTHNSYSYCKAGPDGVRESFDAMRGEAWRKFGLEGL